MSVRSHGDGGRGTPRWEHAQFSNSRRVSFCRTSIDTRDCRLLIAVDGEQGVQGGGRRGRGRWRGGCSSSSRAERSQGNNQFGACQPTDWFISPLHLVRATTPNRTKVWAVLGGCDSNQSFRIDHHHRCRRRQPALSSHRAVLRKPKSPGFKHD